jgi:3-deoxy-D-manno-octulosonic-acid transferase
VADGAALGAAVRRLMGDDSARERMAEAAARLHQENQGATARTLERIAEFLEV